MNLTDLSIKRPITIIMITLILILLGAVSLSRLNIDLLPEMNLPIAVVMTSYEGAGPQEVEEMVTKPLEEALATTNNLKTISSTSTPSNSMVLAEFNWGTDMDFATLQMREKIDLAKRLLPSGTGAPMVFRFDPSMIPVMQIGLTGGKDLGELKHVAETDIKPKLEKIEGVASVSVVGGLQREIQVIVDPQKLEGYSLSLNQVISALQSENLNLPGGQVQEGRSELLVRTTGEYDDVRSIGETVIVTPQGGRLTLNDIATINDTHKQITEYAYMDGKPSVALLVQKQTNANTVKVATQVKRELNVIQKELPSNISYAMIMDMSKFIQLAISNVTSNAVAGAILAALILYIFLRNFRSTLVISIAIPISIISTFILMYFSGLTLNMMSLGGLALGTGMLVDNSIVVLENIYRYRRDGYDAYQAAKQGTTEVAMAITASTLTTVAVFLPIVFIEGLVSEIFKQLAMTVTFSLMASLIVSITLVPMLSSKLMDTRDGGTSTSILGKTIRWVGERLNALNARYENALRWCLAHRKRVLVMVGAAFILSVVLISVIGAEFMPAMDEGQIMVNITTPAGSSLEETSRVASSVESVAQSLPEVETIFSMVGGSAESGTSTQSNSSTVVLNLKKARIRSTQDVIEDIRQKVATTAGARITVSAPSAMGSGGDVSPVQINVKGPDLKVLEATCDRIASSIKDIEGIREVKTSFTEGRPEVQIRVLKEKAGYWGLPAAQVASTVRTAISGQVASKLKISGEEIDIRVMFPQDKTDTVEDIKSLTIKSPMGADVYLSDIAEIKIAKGPQSIPREAQSRSASVSAAVSGRDLAGVIRDVQGRLRALPLPQGYSLSYGGENQQMMEAFTSLTMALGLAIALVYMIMAAQFESLVHPFTIMFTVPLAAIGVILALAITRHTLSVPSFIGVITLVGIVVNNAIVLVDYVNTLRKRGMERNDAILKAGPTRLRPILMTTLTTILGLLPLATGLGEGAEMRAPIAVVIIGGLTFSTFLTLLVIPVVYTIFDDLTHRRLLRRKERELPIRS